MPAWHVDVKSGIIIIDAFVAAYELPRAIREAIKHLA